MIFITNLMNLSRIGVDVAVAAVVGGRSCSCRGGWGRGCFAIIVMSIFHGNG